MNDLIELSELLSELDREIKRVPACAATLQRARSIALTIPSVPAEVVRHGRWKTLYLNSHVCSECNDESEDRNRYCAYCGARMDGQGEGDSNG